MRFVRILILVIVALTIWQPRLPIVTADQVTTEITLYAHTDPSATQVGGRTLSLSSNATSPHSADIRDGLSFTLLPTLASPLHIAGTITVYVWLKSAETLRGTLNITLSEVWANASVQEIRSSSVTSPVTPNAYLVIFSLGTIDYTLNAGSTLKFEAWFSPVRPVPVMLLWDSTVTPTRLVMEVESSPKITLLITDIQGRTSTIFAENNTFATKLNANTTVEDPFGGTNVRSVSLTVRNSTGFPLIQDASMNLTSRTEKPYRLEYLLTAPIPSGHFNFTARVLDAANRTFETSVPIIVTRFYTLTVINLDSERKPLSGLSLSFHVGDVLMDGDGVRPIETNSTGMATSSNAPNSTDVGRLTIRAMMNGLVVGTKTVGVQSNTTIVVEWPLYPWDISVIFPLLGIPVASAQVSLDLNRTFVNSTLTDPNGIAHFSYALLGKYDVRVSWWLFAQNFTDVMHSPNQGTELVFTGFFTPLVMLLVAGVVGVVAIFGTLAFIRRRRRTRRFRHAAELVGGAIPQSAVVMIVGPSGSGKSLLLQNMLADYLRAGRRCVYVSNCERPSNLKERLGKMGLDVRKLQDSKMLGFVDAYSGTTGAVSSEKYSVPSARDLTTLGIQLTSCLEELGEPGDVFFDSLVPVVASGDLERGFDFVEYYGARTKNAGGTFLYVTSTTIEPKLLNRLEELADFVLQTEKHDGPGDIRGRLLVKKARDTEHERDWVGFKISSNGRMKFVSLPSEKP
jgi:KaiC/GvpD/RAD55 family RecA-like ATPase